MEKMTICEINYPKLFGILDFLTYLSCALEFNNDLFVSASSHFGLPLKTLRTELITLPSDQEMPGRKGWCLTESPESEGCVFSVKLGGP